MIRTIQPRYAKRICLTRVGKIELCTTRRRPVDREFLRYLQCKVTADVLVFIYLLQKVTLWPISKFCPKFLK